MLDLLDNCDSGLKIPFIVLQDCAPQCKVLLMAEESDEQRSMLIHNKNGRYETDPLPIAPGSTVRSNDRFEIPNDCIHDNSYQITEEDKVVVKKGLAYLKSKRGTRCPQMGGYCTEYNFFHCCAVGLTLGETKDMFLGQLRATYQSFL